MKTLIRIAAGTAATLALAGTAQAGCNTGTYCSGSSYMGQSYSSNSVSTPSYTTSSASGGYTGSSSLPPLSSYFDGNANSTSYAASSYSSADSYASSYPSGSISSSYTLDDTTVYGFSGSTTSAPGLGMGESLQATSCPVNVDAAPGSRVLGCYSVVRQVQAPVAKTTYYRVVRPVVYVRYPVPVPVPYAVTSPCATNVAYSRYGDYHYGGYGYRGGYRGCR